ncbi:MAG TPA: hypothetical protein PK381_02200 [Anaerolineaceae bacterium]|nr:hypothetical protein [Anaerolineaceae bacterium]
MLKEGLFKRVRNKLALSLDEIDNKARIRKLAEIINENKKPAQGQAVIFFNASTRLSRLSLNAGFSRLASWALELQGVPVVHFVCQRGLQPCVLGTNRKDERLRTPCHTCILESEILFEDSQSINFDFSEDHVLESVLEGLDLEDLYDFTHLGIPLGALVLPAVRWILRRHHLEDDEMTLMIYKGYVRSAWSFTQHFEKALDELAPRALVVYNGVLYPEGVAKWLAQRRGIRVVSHEVGFQPLSAYFTDGDATAYDLDIPADFALDESQNERLDNYLRKRFQGDFFMAGVQFWPEMSQLSPEFLAKAREFRQVVPVFTNVIFDTSQVHANLIFEHMFAWLDNLLEVAKANPDTLFVVRAHPDEAREGKASEESVADWAKSRDVENLPNVLFIPPHEFINSYDLIRMAKFVMIYNSTIGMEASILGATVLSAGKARFTASNVVHFPADRKAYDQTLQDFLNAENLSAPPEHKFNARRFLYYQLYRSSLVFDAFLEQDKYWQGYVMLKDFDWQSLLPENSPAIQTFLEGMLANGNFMLKEDA